MEHKSRQKFIIVAVCFKVLCGASAIKYVSIVTEEALIFILDINPRWTLQDQGHTGL